MLFRHQGYSYYWEKYFIDSQGSENDLYAYRYDLSPLKITGTRTYQGAGDMRGLMDVYEVLTHSFSDDDYLQDIERKAFYVLEQIVDSQRADNSFVFSPYYGTSLDESLISDSVINDALLISPSILPEGLEKFTGTMTVMDFLITAQSDLDVFGTEKMSIINDEVKVSIQSIIKLFGEKIEPSTFGIPKQTILGFEYQQDDTTQLYGTKNTMVNVNFLDLYNHNITIPDWIFNYNPFTFLGTSYIYQWDYLNLLQEAFLILEDPEIISPLFESMALFTEDFTQDNEYQLLSICEVKDAVARTFFVDTLVDTSIVLSDKTGIFGNAIPYYYRTAVSPVTYAFAAETPQRISALILTILPMLTDIIEIINDPINQIVIFGFVSGVIMTVAVVYIRRPKHQ